MAEAKPAAGAAKTVTSVQPKKTSNAVSWIAPLTCIILGYIIWRFVIGAPGNFDRPDAAGGFWPDHQGPKSALSRMYLGGIIVPILIGSLLTVLTFVIERFMTVSKATGGGNISEFIRKVQYHLANKDVSAAMKECDKQKGSVGNVMKAGLRKYQEMIENHELTTEQKVLNIQKEVEKTRETETLHLIKHALGDDNIDKLITQLLDSGKLTPSVILSSLCQGNFEFFEFG